MEAFERRRQREAQRRFRELQRREKEQAKLSAIEKARLEVETYENQLELLLSIHKEQGDVWDWNSIYEIPPPTPPKNTNDHETNAANRLNSFSPSIYEIALGKADKESARLVAEVDVARQEDEGDFQKAWQKYQKTLAEWEKDHQLAKRILAGDSKAYVEALSELSPFAEIAELGSSVNFAIENSKVIECSLKVNGKDAIPVEVKSLTANGKVSIKPMPKARFHEIYQDYLCGCVLRVAREVFALLPVETVLITATADVFDSSTGRTTEQPVLSVAVPWAVLGRLQFDRLDPSDSMDSFLHRGDFKTSRKSGEFVPITPLKSSDLCKADVKNVDVNELLARVRELREGLKAEISDMTPEPETASSEDTLP